jgi:SNF2 family DNA or RNA helicase
MRLQTNCNICNKQLVLIHTWSLSTGTAIAAKNSSKEESACLDLRVTEQTNKYSSDVPVNPLEISFYKCGHFTIKEKPKKRELDYTSADGSKHLRDYQKEGVEFIFDSDFNCIIGDQMRLGKTPQSLIAYKNVIEERSPCLIVVRAANTYQWVRELKIWADESKLGIFLINGSKQWIPPGFNAYIISMDTLSRGDRVKDLLEFGFKLVIVDEAHSFKNTESKRSQALIQFLRDISTKEITKELNLNCPLCTRSWTEEIKINLNLRGSTLTSQSTHKSYCPDCKALVITGIKKEEMKKKSCGAILLTGTAIKNRADEYFVPLNIVAPEKFPSLEQFRRKWLVQDGSKWSRVNPYLYESFKKEIAPYVLRREKEDVYTDLPPLNRMFQVIEIEDERLKAAYNRVLDTMELNMSRGNYKFFDNIGELMQLRQICGIAKCGWTANYIEACLMDSDKSKYAIGVHHHSVRDNMFTQLGHLGTLRLSGEDSPEQKDRIMRQFEHSQERILVINMLAGGVGMDFHYCHNVLILERQWSSADEEQFEFRFYNPDKSIMGEAQTDIEYIIAKGTIDEWFYDLVESKRAIFGETISNNWNIESDAGSFRDLMEKTVSSRL